MRCSAGSRWQQRSWGPTSFGRSGCKGAGCGSGHHGLPLYPVQDIFILQGLLNRHSSGSHMRLRYPCTQKFRAASNGLKNYRSLFPTPGMATLWMIQRTISDAPLFPDAENARHPCYRQGRQNRGTLCLWCRGRRTRGFWQLIEILRSHRLVRRQNEPLRLTKR